MQWMNCTTCKKVVLQNSVGICIACQSGFDKEIDDDEYYKLKNLLMNHDYYDEEDQERLTEGFKKNASKKRKVKESYQ